MLPEARALAHLKDNWELNRRDIQCIKKLGEGSFGEVWYGTWRNSLPVAIKKVKPAAMSPEAFLREAAIMKKFNHPRVVKLYGVITRSTPLLIVTEFMKHKSLIHFLCSPTGRTLNFNHLCSVAYQIASGMDYIESKKLVHRDLAARNVLVGDGLTVKICDFGLARAIVDGEYQQLRSTTFPIKWTAPEGIIQRRFTIKSDVWSYGILLTELFTYGQDPYPGIAPFVASQMVLRGYRMPKPPHATDHIYRIMLQCWDIHPSRRPSFAQLKSQFRG